MDPLTNFREFFITQPIHKRFGAKDIDPQVVSLSRSDRPEKKYKAVLTNGKTIYFGQSSYQHYHDRIGLWSSKNHEDPARRLSFIKRMSKVENDEKKFINDPTSPLFYSLRALW